MSRRLDVALAELADAIRDEVCAQLAERGDDPPQLLSIAQATTRLGIGRSALYDAIGRGELRSIKIGRRRLIPVDGLASLQSGTAGTNKPTVLGSNRDASATDHRPAA